MITTFLQGGLGNYLFQIATAYSHSLDMGTDCVFNENSAVRIHRPIAVYKDNILRNVKFSNSIQCDVNYYEHTCGFQYSELPKEKSLHLDGYYQTEKYFNHRRNDILELFKPKDEHVKYITEKYGDLNNTCSIHVRRGDYLLKQSHHPVCSLDYYRNAISMIPKGVRFIVLSDDIEWCKNNFLGDDFTFVENELDYIDVYIMSMCDHNIIANSTFSWWGAWLNNNPNKMVVAPIKWFGTNKNLNTKDIIPKKWMKI